ncbi:MAG: hypothetical protein QFX35_05865 [Candidatus Verstraetearchaeota archaeon]|nr:hypothetical protein [Candidatus Verstraetearchaeota archaeon]
MLKPGATKLLLVASALGFLGALATGSIRNEPGVGLPELKHYGYPLPWIVTDINGPNQYIPANLALDALFWGITTAVAALFFARRFALPRTGRSCRSLLLSAVILLSAGLLMCFVHELGHALWGIAAGGSLAYIKVAFFELYPDFALTPEFDLGITMVEGLPYGSVAYGTMLLGGSVSTSVASWAFAPALLWTGIKGKLRTALKAAGVFGMLDLPLYALLPQIGLRHWVFLGGSDPEPLIGARMAVVPDPAFYLAVALFTLGLVVAYSESLQKWILTRAGLLP